MSETPRTNVTVTKILNTRTTVDNWQTLIDLAGTLERELTEARKPQVTVEEFIEPLAEGTFVTNGRIIWKIICSNFGAKGLACDVTNNDINFVLAGYVCMPNLRVIEEPKSKKRVADYFVLFPGPIVDTRNGESNIFVKEIYEIGTEPEGAVLIPGSERIKHD